MLETRSNIKVEPEAELPFDDDGRSNEVINNCLQDANRQREPQHAEDNFGKEKENFVSPIGKENDDIDRHDVKNDIVRLKHEPELVILDVHENIPVIACQKYPLVALRNCLITRTSAPFVEVKNDTEACIQIIADETVSEQHIDIDRPENVRSFQCYNCRKTFSDDKECRWHMFSLCLSRKIPIVRLVDCMKTFGDKANQKCSASNSRLAYYECYRCKQMFHSLASLLKHLNQTHSSDRTDTVERPYLCKYPQCYRKYKSHHYLKEHMITHGERKYFCKYPNCNGAFFTAKALRLHKTVHTDKRKYVCAHEQCEKKFKCRGTLRVHENIHNVDAAKRYVCKYVKCDKAFRSNGKLIRHYVTHMKNPPRPFMCTFPRCGKSFPYSETLKSHSLTHVDDKPFACDQCDKKCKSKGNLEKHFRSHSDARPFPCDHENCGKSFKSTAELGVHKLIHSDQRLYVCTHPKCDKKFKTSGLLAFHRRVHSSEKPFVCTKAECGKAYKSKPNLNRHQKQRGHHRNNEL